MLQFRGLALFHEHCWQIIHSQAHAAESRQRILLSEEMIKRGLRRVEHGPANPPDSAQPTNPPDSAPP